MSYQALYRKYRPKNLNEVYGQKVAVSILKNAVQENKFGHAYLFTGSRGCGKTSVAKILARMVNCENIKDGIPCGECSGCLNSSSNNCVDILEIDAASNNGVDEIRELKSKVNLIPSVLKYKVYIIDEVHMLSTGAFNALLKTLEEPPEHVIFILATTELHKVPITIISRCQTIEFKKINNKDMFARLKEISQLENINITDDAINEIVNESDGGLRDAIGLLDMATSYNNTSITEEDIITINGNISSNEIDFLADTIIKKNLSTTLKLINDYYDSGKDLIKIFEKVILNLKEKMIKNNDFYICEIIKELATAIDKMRDSSIGKIYLEIALFKLANAESEPNKKEISPVIKTNKQEPIKTIKEEPNDKNIIEPTTNKDKQAEKSIIIEPELKPIKNTFKLKDIRVNNTLVDANKQILINVKNNWPKLNDYTFDKEYGALVCELIDSIPLTASPSHLILGYQYDSFVEKGNTYIEKYERALKNTLGIETKLIFVSNEEWTKIKKEYIENLKNNVKYNYIEETNLDEEPAPTETSSVETKKSDLVEKANELFDITKIEIKEK